MIRTLTKYHSGDPTKNNEMGGACRMYRGQDRFTQYFGGET
jgi:hypothetical protein